MEKSEETAGDQDPGGEKRKGEVSWEPMSVLQTFGGAVATAIRHSSQSLLFPVMHVFSHVPLPWGCHSKPGFTLALDHGFEYLLFPRGKFLLISEDKKGIYGLCHSHLDLRQRKIEWLCINEKDCDQHHLSPYCQEAPQEHDGLIFLVKPPSLSSQWCYSWMCLCKPSRAGIVTLIPQSSVGSARGLSPAFVELNWIVIFKAVSEMAAHPSQWWPQSPKWF